MGVKSGSNLVPTVVPGENGHFGDSDDVRDSYLEC